MIEDYDVKGIRETLQRLPKLMPRESQIIYGFGYDLGELMSDTETPSFFTLHAELQIKRVMKLIEEAYNLELGSTRLGIEPSIRRRFLTDILDILPDQEFAEGVRDFYRENGYNL